MVWRGVQAWKLDLEYCVWCANWALFVKYIALALFQPSCCLPDNADEFHVWALSFWSLYLLNNSVLIIADNADDEHIATVLMLKLADDGWWCWSLEMIADDRRWSWNLQMMADDLHNDHVENLVSADPWLQGDRSQLDDQFMVVRNDQRMPQTFAAGHLIISRMYVDQSSDSFFWWSFHAFAHGTVSVVVKTRVQWRSYFQNIFFCISLWHTMWYHSNKLIKTLKLQAFTHVD